MDNPAAVAWRRRNWEPVNKDAMRRIGSMSEYAAIVDTVRRHYPDVQAVYLFGSHGTDRQWPESDIDIALLLPHEQAKSERNIVLSPCRFDLQRALHREVDLVNARRVSTVFQKEIIGGGRLIYCADRYALDEFEMLVISYYQKLNEERRHVLAAFNSTGRAYAV